MMPVAPGLEHLERLAREEYDALPATFRDNFGALLIRVVDFPDAETEEAMGLESPFELLGLYHGVPLPYRSVLDLPRPPDRIDLYRRPLLDYWVETGESLRAVVRHVLIHELGHHLGFSDADMAAIEAQAG